MIIRFLAKNIYSFKEQTEFNLLPSSKTENLPHHKIKRGEIEFLRYGAIYGGNGVGKTNLVKAISLLKYMVMEKEEISNTNMKFRIGEDNIKLPTALGIEFTIQQKIFFYTITFDNGQVLYEYLAETFKNKEDKLIFERYVEGETQKIDFGEDFNDDNNLEHKAFLNAFSKLIPRDKLAIHFWAKIYPSDFKDVKLVYDWFSKKLIIIRPYPYTQVRGLAHFFDLEKDILSFAKKFIFNLNIGISDIKVHKQKVNKDNLSEEIQEILSNDGDYTIAEGAGEQISLVNEEGNIYSKRVITSHNGSEFRLGEESDGTRRLFDYIPAIQDIITDEKVYIIDEIERSIHPLLIKEIITKLALDEKVKGQLIFTTHETNLLSQSILRPDEIWLTEKNNEGATEIYPLSDFKIHNTINIENGYLSGRYGGIPILSNLKELKW